MIYSSWSVLNMEIWKDDWTIQGITWISGHMYKRRECMVIVFPRVVSASLIHVQSRLGIEICWQWLSREGQGVEDVCRKVISMRDTYHVSFLITVLSCLFINNHYPFIYNKHVFAFLSFITYLCTPK